MADEAALAVENFPTVAALGFGFFELGLVKGLNVLVAELGSPAAVGSEGGDGAEDAGCGGDLVILEVLGGLAASAASVQRVLQAAAADET
eukprot:scaffold17579_cov134-Isochrysis_galbana.AAC.4